MFTDRYFSFPPLLKKSQQSALKVACPCLLKDRSVFKVARLDFVETVNIYKLQQDTSCLMHSENILTTHMCKVLTFIGR